jgi:hypothetical protein
MSAGHSTATGSVSTATGPTLEGAGRTSNRLARIQGKKAFVDEALGYQYAKAHLGQDFLGRPAGTAYQNGATVAEQFAQGPPTIVSTSGGRGGPTVDRLEALAVAIEDQ